MTKILIIVESPAKIKTLRKFLGKDYLFESSVGHIRDLPARGFGIDVENDFEPIYEPLPEKEKVIKQLIKAAKEADEVYLCPDPDREGEAIAWHIAQLLPQGTKIKRAAFHSITKDEVVRALAHTTDINYGLVNAQQARRLLDRIVGYKISPILARRIQGGRRQGGSLSAGRVQSVALKLVVDREKEIEAFIPIEYWTLSALLDKGGETFKATLHSVDGKRVEKEAIAGKEVCLISDASTAKSLKTRLEGAIFTTSRVEKKEKKRNPVAPFITSTLQQEASRHHGFSSARTMSVAQGLYEGVDLGAEGPEGLITYMRTDSVKTAPEATQAVRSFIEKEYGTPFLAERPRMFASKKSAQEAHEAIRPANLKHTPEKIKSFLTRDQFLLYSLIWKRFVASQMSPAVYDTVSADIVTNSGLLLRATGSTLKFKGFLAVYEEKREEEEKGEASASLPPLEEGESLIAKEIEMEQSFTRPPARFSEASLVRELETCGIGRPSTYAAIMNKIQSREYTRKEQGRIIPTELGRVCAQMLEENFPQVMNIDFTAHMEDDLELVAESKKEWKKLIRDFWENFIPTVEKAEEEAFVPRILTDLPCPKCGKLLQKIWSRSKYFYGCSGYPDCDYSGPLEEMSFDKSEYVDDFNWEQPCPLCGKEMKVRHGRFGVFLGCSDYPSCRGTVNVPKKGETHVPPGELPPCPAKGCEGRMTARRSRYGKIFYSCSTFPECDVIVNKLDQLQEKYPHHERTPYVKKGAKKEASSAKPKPAKTAKKKKTSKREAPLKALSPELAAVVGAENLSRGDCLKALWAYIKKEKRQDPENGRLIIPDKKLAALFGSSEPIDMFKLAGIISHHLK
ncbi:MAG: type I DNA topoisomerase [Verrucomicrobia bacterium]|nr:type I DNA topoisomerase [Verrucomicrobiota bacterium]